MTIVQAFKKPFIEKRALRLIRENIQHSAIQAYAIRYDGDIIFVKVFLFDIEYYAANPEGAEDRAQEAIIEMYVRSLTPTRKEERRSLLMYKWHFAIEASFWSNYYKNKDYTTYVNPTPEKVDMTTPVWMAWNQKIADEFNDKVNRIRGHNFPKENDSPGSPNNSCVEEATEGVYND